MRITTEQFFIYNAKGIFLFALATQIFPAFQFMGSTNYLTYLAPVAILFCLGVSAASLKNEQQVNLDGILIFLIIYLFNCLILVEVDYFRNTDGVRFIATPILFLCFYIIFNNFESKEVFYTSLKALVIVALVQALIGVSQALFGVPFFENILSSEDAFNFERNYFAFFFPSLFENSIQASGTFSHFIALGVFLVFSVPISFSLWKETKNNFWLLAFIIIWVGIVATFSRGALIGAALSTIIIYFSYTKHKIEKIFLSILCFSLLYVLVSPLIEEYSSQTSNFGGRYKTWVYSINYAMKHPENLFFGYGYSNVRKVLAAQNIVYTNFHSSFVQMFIELGLVGIISFFTGIYFVIKNVFINKSPWAYCLLAIVTGFLFTQLFEQHLYSFHGLIFFTLLGLFQANILQK